VARRLGRRRRQPRRMTTTTTKESPGDRRQPGPGERFGERVAAVVSLRPGASAGTDASREHCRMTLAGYKVPASIAFVTEVMRSPVGKADYHWRAPALAGPEPAPPRPS
jgi:hypothetical protein